MVHPSLKDDPNHWRRLAHDARATADQLDDPVAKQTMIEIAEGYEQLASIAARKAACQSNR
jgi:hypothetical protein